MPTDIETAEDQPGRTFYFFFDAETTGLRVEQDTVLEVAWCLTDEDLRLVTPLRQRFASIKAGPSGRVGSRNYGYAFDPAEPEDWHNNERISDLVRDMHTDSSLRAEWVLTAEQRPYRLLRHATDFTRLAEEDLDLVRFDNQHDRLVLAGAGVSHFDNDLLTVVFDGFYPERPIIGGSWAYWCFDTSVAVRVAGARDAVDELATRLAKPVDSGEEILPFSLVACEVGPEQDETDRLVVSNKRGTDEGGLEEFVRDYAVEHRAADDVMCSLLDARALRYLVGAR
jgi:hypothetical protein